jgi:hypothetical protein
MPAVAMTVVANELNPAIDALRRLTRLLRCERFAEERLSCRDTTISAKQEIHCHALFVDSAVRIMPFAFDRDMGLVNSPRGTDRFGESRPTFREFRNIACNPTKNGRVRHFNAALGHNLNEITVR